MPSMYRLTAKAVANITKPGRYSDGGNLLLLVSKTGHKTWAFRFKRGRERRAGLGSVDVISLAEARDVAAAMRKQLHAGLDPIEVRRAERKAKPAGDVRQKWISFIEQGIAPQCYLYRHYAPNGDLLYVGITLEGVARSREHMRGSAWASAIYQIVIEPFETREQALAAEEVAIRSEFPKHNTRHNGRDLARELKTAAGRPKKRAGGWHAGPVTDN